MLFTIKLSKNSRNRVKQILTREDGRSTMDSVLALHPVTLGLILGVPEDLFLTEIYHLNVAEVNRQQLSMMLTVQKLNNVDRNQGSLKKVGHLRRLQ